VGWSRTAATWWRRTTVSRTGHHYRLPNTNLLRVPIARLRRRSHSVLEGYCDGREHIAVGFLSSSEYDGLVWRIKGEYDESVAQSHSHLDSGWSISKPGTWMACYPQIRHELSRISLRRLSRRHCLSRLQRLFEIERKPNEVPRLVQSVQTNADSNRDALGFLPAQAYEQAARQGTLFVAVDRRGPEPRYAGHILFGATYPHAKVFQVYVAPQNRKHGVGRLLVETLLNFLEEKQYLSVTARVASELPANAFWNSLKFEIVATKSGGMTRGRTINVRARQFNTPALFGYRRPVSGIPLTDPLPNFTTIFALDLNVFFDVAKRRPRSQYGAVVMSAAFNNIMRLTVTQEFVNELRRSATNTQDPILEFALQLPTLPAPPSRSSSRNG
jgi:GNAT superfamily N-acetyltransferase